MVALDLSGYKNKLLRWMKFLIAEKKIHNLTQRCCITISDQEISLLHIDKKENKIQILLSEILKYDNIENLPYILSSLIKTYRLSNIPAHWLLQLDEYQLFLIESLPVPEEEFEDALKWRVRSLINFPIQEATMDYFKIPAKKSAPDSPLIAAVAAKSNRLLMVSELLKKSGLLLTNISIPELALKNLSSLYETDEKSTASLYFTNNFAVLNITRKKDLYFTRRINLTAPIDPAVSQYEQLSLDILRYFDYFQSQWRLPSPHRVLIFATSDKVLEASKTLTEHLMLSVEPFHLKKLELPESQLQKIEHNFLLPFGCLLQEEVVDDSAN